VGAYALARDAVNDLPRTRRLKSPLNSACTFLFSALLLLHAAPSDAQLQSNTGGLAGQVFCSDTQKPARFAMVILVPDETETVSSYLTRRGGGGTRTSTAADGTFTMKDISPGVYDIQVVMPGYVQPLRQLNLFPESDTASRQPFLKMLTRVTIESGQTANATVTAYRGADLIGSVDYDDGTPAAGITVSALIALAPTGAGTSSSSANTVLRSVGGNAQTDDRGRFHLSGLADGTYTIQGLPRGGELFPVYLGNTIERTKAVMVTVKSGEERSGLDLLMDLTNLHRVRGVLTSPDSHALPNANVFLSLTDSPGNPLDATTGPDGSFAFSAVPDGKFTVAVSGAADPDTHIVYRGASTQVTVAGSDINDVVLTPTQ
jgi:hypothetical protein